MVHNLSDKELMVHPMDLLEKGAGFNTIDAKPIDICSPPQHFRQGQELDQVKGIQLVRQPETKDQPEQERCPGT